MKPWIWFAMASVLFGCGSDSSKPLDAATSPDGRSDGVTADAPVDTGVDMPHESHDVVWNDVPVAPEAGKLDTGTIAEVGKLDSAVDLSPVRLDGATDQGDVPAPPADVADGPRLDGGESCSCGNASGGSASKVPWSCFCSVESCGRTVGDFVTQGDGGRAVKPGNRTVVVKEFAECNLVLVQAKTYSDYVQSSEYVFEWASGALLGARVWLDDRQHSCPFPGTSGWVFGYESGSYPVPATCRVTGCIAGSGSCGGVDAL